MISDCATCQAVNPSGPNQGAAPGTRIRGPQPGANWEIDHTEIKPGTYGYKYLPVFINTFSGWIEAYPIKKETVNAVAKKLLEDIMSRYGLPTLLGSDNGPAFISQVTQSLARVLGASWKLHCAYRPQSSGQVERMNQTLKEALTKLTLETGSDWVSLLPMPYIGLGTPLYFRCPHLLFEILYGGPSPLLPSLQSDILAEYDPHKF